MYRNIALAASRAMLRNATTAAPAQPLSFAVRQARYLSASARCNGRVLFEKTGNPELDRTLETILHKIILPARLPQQQRELVFNTHRRQELLENPVVMEVEGYEYTFPSIDPLGGDVPPTRQIFWTAVNSMRTRKDWENFGTLLYGMREAGREWTPGEEAKMIRMAGVSGNIFAIVDAARRANETGMLLNTIEKVAKLLSWIGAEASRSHFDDQRTRQAARWAELVDELIQDSRHVVSSRPLHRDPMVQALILFPVSAVSAKLEGGKDTGGLVAARAKMVTTLWPQGKALRTMYQPVAYKNSLTGVDFLNSTTNLLSTATNVIGGTRLAAQVLKNQADQTEDTKQTIAGLEKIRFQVEDEIRQLSSSTDMVGRPAWDELQFVLESTK